MQPLPGHQLGERREESPVHWADERHLFRWPAWNREAEAEGWRGRQQQKQQQQQQQAPAREVCLQARQEPKGAGKGGRKPLGCPRIQRP